MWEKLKAPITPVRVFLWFLYTALHVALVIGTPYFFWGPDTVSLFWPAAGVAVAFILMGGWWFVAATVVAAGIETFFISGTVLTQVFFAAATILEASLVLPLLHLLAKIDIAFVRMRDYGRFLAFAVILLPLPSAVLGALGVQASGTASVPFVRLALEWWMGDSLGILLIAPAILVWRNPSMVRVTTLKVLEMLAVFALTFALTYGLFHSDRSVAQESYAFLLFIFVSWAAVSFGRHGTLLLTTVIVGFTLVSIALYRQALGASALHFGYIWVLIATLSAVGMSLAVVFSEKRLVLRRNEELLSAYRLEEKRRESADKSLNQKKVDYERLVEAATEGVWVTDREGTTTFCNERMARLLGYTVQEMQGTSFLDYLVEKEPKEKSILFERRVRGEKFIREQELLSKNKRVVCTLMSTTPLQDLEGNVASVLSLVTDISERKKTELLLKESEERYSKIVEKISDGVLIHEAGTIVYANPAAAELFGEKDSRRLVGLNALSFTHPEDQEVLGARMQELLKSGIGTFLPTIRQRIIRKSGQVVYIESMSALISYQGRKAFLVIGRRV